MKPIVNLFIQFRRYNEYDREIDLYHVEIYRMVYEQINTQINALFEDYNQMI